MKGKELARLVEWGKTLLIILLAISAVYLLGKTQFSRDVLGGVKGLLEGGISDHEQGRTEQVAAVAVRPMQIAFNLEDGQRYGVQYDLAETDSVSASISTLLSEAMSSAGTPQKISEYRWRSEISDVGIYLDFYYPLPLAVMAGQTEEGANQATLSAVARRICLAAGRNDEVSLLYISEEDGGYYSCTTTLSHEIHLTPVLDGQSANGAMFAFEVPGMENVAPYMLLTTTPQPVKYQTGNPLQVDESRVGDLLTALSFQARGSELDPVAGGLHVEGSDSLRLLESGVLTFHTFGNADFRFLPGENTLQSALDYTQELASATIGKWCGDANLSLSGVQESSEGLEILYQYGLNGVPVHLPEGAAAARFVIRGGAITDFSLYFRSYTATEETTLLLPERQAAAVMDATAQQGNELVLLYRDTGGEITGASWIAS